MPTFHNIVLPVHDPAKYVPHLNVKKDKVDKRDYIFKPTAILLPGSVDLRRYDSPIQDQGYLGSCTGNAVAGACQLILKRELRPQTLSRLFIYYQERLLEGTVNYDAGAYLRDGIKSMYSWGSCLETIWQYNDQLLTVKPSSVAYSDARRRRVTLYQRCLDFKSVKAALAKGIPVVVGFVVYDSFMTSNVAYTGRMPYPDIKTENVVGAHAVCLVGYDDSKQIFIARNSWGTTWGDRGYFYMPYKVIQNPDMGWDYWAISGMSLN